MFPYPLNNFEIQKYYQNETKSRGVYSRNNLPQKKKKKKIGAHIANLDEYQSNGTLLITFYVNGNNGT